MGNSRSTPFRTIFDEALKGPKQGQAFGVKRSQTPPARPVTERKPVKPDVDANLKIAERRAKQKAKTKASPTDCDKTNECYIWFSANLTSAMNKCYPESLLACGCGSFMIHCIIVILMSMLAAYSVDENKNVALGMTVTGLIVVDAVMFINGATRDTLYKLNVLYMVGLVLFLAWFNGLCSRITERVFKSSTPHTPPQVATELIGLNIEAYIGEIIRSESARELFGHNSTFALSTMCAAIVGQLDHSLHQCSLFANTTSVMRSAMQESWSEIGFYLFSLMSKENVWKGISDLKVQSQVFRGSELRITNFRINDEIKADELLISTNNLNKTARLLWLFRYMYAVYGVGEKSVPMSNTLVSGDPVETMGSILRCFDKQYDNDNDANAVLFGNTPRNRQGGVTTHTRDVQDIITYMGRYDYREKTRDHKKDSRRLLKDK